MNAARCVRVEISHKSEDVHIIECAQLRKCCWNVAVKYAQLQSVHNFLMKTKNNDIVCAKTTRPWRIR